ncbi:MAG: hypothetical protein RI924_1528 [Bacteroidota bacterium]|jgi:hypothetical protein
MKKMMLLILISGLSVYTRAQELKKITRRPNLVTTETYHVLKSDKKIKQGLYRKITQASQRQLVEEGYYKMGKKDSLWTKTQDGKLQRAGTYKDDQKHGLWMSYGRLIADKQILIDSGAYHMGKKTGIWKYYDREGRLNLIFDYDRNIKIFQSRDTLNHLILIGRDTLVSTLEHNPIYRDGWDKFYYTVAHNIRFNNQLFAKTMHLKTRIYIAFDINEAGQMENIKAISNTPKELNETVINAIRATEQNNWLPGIYEGKAVKTQIIVPFNFKNKGMR